MSRPQIGPDAYLNVAVSVPEPCVLKGLGSRSNNPGSPCPTPVSVGGLAGTCAPETGTWVRKTVAPDAPDAFQCRRPGARARSNAHYSAQSLESRRARPKSRSPSLAHAPVWCTAGRYPAPMGLTIDRWVNTVTDSLFCPTLLYPRHEAYAHRMPTSPPSQIPSP